jgi:hypothetical protein
MAKIEILLRSEALSNKQGCVIHMRNHLQQPFSSIIKTYANTQFNLKTFSNIILIIGLLLAYLASLLLPYSMGWEDGILEWTQAAIILIGCFTVIYYHYKVSERQMGRFWYAQVPVWLIMFGREISWGAAFLPYEDFNVITGPTLIHLKELSYAPIVYPLLAVLFILTVYWAVRCQLFKIIGQLWREHNFPKLTLLITISAIIIASCAEKHLFATLGNRSQILDKYI